MYCIALYCISGLYCIVSYRISLHHIASYHNTSDEMTWRHVTSRRVTSRHVTSHHITSHRITSHHITSHHITSNMASYRIVLCCFGCLRICLLLFYHQGSVFSRSVENPYLYMSVDHLFAPSKIQTLIFDHWSSVFIAHNFQRFILSSNLPEAI